MSSAHLAKLLWERDRHLDTLDWAVEATIACRAAVRCSVGGPHLKRSVLLANAHMGIVSATNEWLEWSIRERRRLEGGVAAPVPLRAPPRTLDRLLSLGT